MHTSHCGGQSSRLFRVRALGFQVASARDSWVRRSVIIFISGMQSSGLEKNIVSQVPRKRTWEVTTIKLPSFPKKPLQGCLSVMRRQSFRAVKVCHPDSPHLLHSAARGLVVTRHGDIHLQHQHWGEDGESPRSASATLCPNGQCDTINTMVKCPCFN